MESVGNFNDQTGEPLQKMFNSNYLGNEHSEDEDIRNSAKNKAKYAVKDEIKSLYNESTIIYVLWNNVDEKASELAKSRLNDKCTEEEYDRKIALYKETFHIAIKQNLEKEQIRYFDTEKQEKIKKYADNDRETQIIKDDKWIALRAGTCIYREGYFSPEDETTLDDPIFKSLVGFYECCHASQYEVIKWPRSP